MNKKGWILLLTALLALTLLTGCGNSKDTAGEDPLADGVLSVAMDDTYLPFEYRDEANNLIGFDVDLSEALAKKLGVDCDINCVSWDGIFTGLTANQYDAVISAVSITPEREEAYSQSDPYIANGIVIVGNKNTNPTATSFKDLDGKTVGVQIETSADIAAKKLIEDTGANVNLKEYDGMLDAFSALEAQQIDYIMTDTAVADYYANKKPEVFVVTTPEPLTNEPVGVTARKEDSAFTQKVNQALEEMRQDGELKAISEKWFGKDLTSNIDTTLNVIE